MNTHQQSWWFTSVNYYHRDEENDSYLKMYNDHFPHAEKLTGELSQVFSFIDNCGFDKASRAWKKTDLFTLIKEIFERMNTLGTILNFISY